MKTSLRILLSVLAITSTMALADESVQRNFSLDKFSYLGVGMKDSKAELVAKGFDCVGSECKREDSKATIKVTYSGDKMQSVETNTFYQKGINCEVNQKEIKDFLTTNYDFEYVNQDRKLLAIPSRVEKWVAILKQPKVRCSLMSIVPTIAKLRNTMLTLTLIL